VDRDAAQKDRLAVQQDLSAARLDGAEADFFLDGILAGAQNYFVEFWRLRGPAFKSLYFHLKEEPADLIGSRRCLCVELWNLHVDLGSRLCAFHMYPALDEGTFAAAEMHIVLVDESRRNLDERDRARKSAVVPPIGFERGHAVFVAGIIDRGDDKVRARMNRRGYLAVEAGVTSLVLADLLPVDPEPGPVVSRAHV